MRVNLYEIFRCWKSTCPGFGNLHKCTARFCRYFGIYLHTLDAWEVLLAERCAKEPSVARKPPECRYIHALPTTLHSWSSMSTLLRPSNSCITLRHTVEILCGSHGVSFASLIHADARPALYARESASGHVLSCHCSSAGRIVCCNRPYLMAPTWVMLLAVDVVVFFKFV